MHLICYDQAVTLGTGGARLKPCACGSNCQITEKAMQLPLKAWNVRIENPGGSRLTLVNPGC